MFPFSTRCVLRSSWETPCTSQAAARALYEAKDMVKCALTLRELRDFGVDREVLVGGGVGLPNAKGVDCLEAKTDGHFLE